MFSQLFGKYLVEKKVLTDTQLREILSEQAHARVKLGTIAVADKLLTQKQAEEINHLQTQKDMRFGDIAVEEGYLTKEQVEALLDKQGNPSMKFIQVLTERGYIDIVELDKYLTGFAGDKGFTPEELKAVKSDDIDAAMRYFIPGAAPYVVETAGLVLRNIMRFVTTDYYVDKAYQTDGFAYSYIMGQKTVGDHNIFLGFATESDNDGILELANGFAKESYTQVNDDVMDAVCEFANMNDGLLASELSNKDVDVDMEPPVVYVDGQAVGSFYVVPVYINGRQVNMCIAIDSDIALGDNKYTITSGMRDGSNNVEGKKATVLIVDDSMLIRKMLRALLEDNDYAVIGEASDGEEAFEKYKKLSPDIVTLDITMPRLDGVGALKKIKDYDGEAKAIMITAAGQKQKVVEALKLGANAFIMKPFDNDDVIRNFENVMK